MEAVTPLGSAKAETKGTSASSDRKLTKNMQCVLKYSNSDIHKTTKIVFCYLTENSVTLVETKCHICIVLVSNNCSDII